MKTYPVLDVLMTPRRKEVLYHIAFTDEIVMVHDRYLSWQRRQPGRDYKVPHLRFKNVSSVVDYLARARLVRWSVGCTPHVTKKGIEVLFACANREEQMDAVTESALEALATKFFKGEKRCP